jgi:uncharacterized membrane protein YqaE (UPF0057 family)
MKALRVLLAILCPPAAVLDKGKWAVLMTVIGTICGYVPGVLIALVSLGLRDPHSAATRAGA